VMPDQRLGGRDGRPVLPQRLDVHADDRTGALR
jgi:hypothetical protein